MIHNHERKKDRGAHRDVHQETTRIESTYGDESGGDREVHDHPHRPAGGAAAAMRALPSAMPGGPQRAQGAGVAGSVAAGEADETAVPTGPRGGGAVGGGGGGLSLGRGLGGPGGDRGGAGK